MPVVKRPHSEPTDDWQQRQLLAPFPEQRAYELLRPVVLFGRPPAERADETGTAERTIYRRAARFDAEGMASLFPPPKVEKHQRLSAKVRAAIRDLKAEHPTFYASEIADICAIRFDQRPSPHTVKRLLAEEPPPVGTARRFPPYREIADPAAARLAIIRLHSEGWAVKSIAAYLDCSRQQVYRTLRRWISEGIAGLDDKSRARADVPRAVTFRAFAPVAARRGERDRPIADPEEELPARSEHPAQRREAGAILRLGREADAATVVEGEERVEWPRVGQRAEIALAQVGVEPGGVGARLLQHGGGDVHARQPCEAALAQDARVPPPAAADLQQPIGGA